MAEVNKRAVDKRSVASAIVGNQVEGIRMTREGLARDGGGERRMRGHIGDIRRQEMIKPGNDTGGSEGVTCTCHFHARVRISSTGHD
jgi:hypothetical protein